MDTRIFSNATLGAFAAAYPARPVKLAHGLLDDPLLSLEALVALATALPERSVEYNPGALPIGIAPEDVPSPELGIAETIRSIEENGSWMVLKRIEQNPAYAALLDRLLGELAAVVTPATGRMLGREGFIFISSPHSVTPFHFDPEHNILLQIRGAKVMTVFPADDEELVPAEAHEKYHLGQHHRNHAWQDRFEGKGLPVALTPGEAVHVPVKAPHWVKNGPDVSISLSITWRSDWSYSEADARAFNHMLRNWGIAPGKPAPFPSRNLAKSLAFRAIRKAGLAPIQ